MGEEGADGFRRSSPLLKWAGGKRWLAPSIGPLIEAHLDRHRSGRYLEPFLGGAAVAFWIGTHRMMLSDIERPLIEAYAAIRDDWRKVAASLKRIVESGTDRETFLRMRASTPTNDWDAAARLVFLNRLCFNGLYRTNSRGHFNVPYGDYSNPTFPSEEQFRKASSVLVEAHLEVHDFEHSISTARSEDIIYADPPYYSDKAGFRSYHQHPFNRHDQERLASSLKEAAARGASILTTNADAAFVRRLYSWAHVTDTAERRAINREGGGRGNARCVLITNIELASESEIKRAAAAT